MVVAGCTGGDGASSTRSAESVPPTTTTRGGLDARHDGEFRLGALFPVKGAGAGTGASMATGVAMAVRDINASGGVGGRPVVIVPADEGDGPDTASIALERLLIDDHVDAVAGPATSRATLSLLEQFRQTRTPSCSPAATATALSDGVDDGLFVRTIGSDLLEGIAVGRTIADTGRTRVALLAPDDDYGLGMTEAIESELERHGGTLGATVRYRSDAVDLSAPVAQALAAEPDAVVVVGLPEPGGRVLSALHAAGVQPGDGAGHVLVLVTDGLRVADLYQRVSPGNRDAIAGVWGVGPATVPGPDQTGFAAALDAYAPHVSPDYAAYAYDCAVLLALAAQAAGESGDISQAVLDVSRGGQRCDTYARCAEALALNADVDYAGVGGEIDLTATGDADRGLYDVFEFNADGSTTIRSRSIVYLP